jgi:hypothetical protein
VHLQESAVVLVHLRRPYAAVDMRPLVLPQVQEAALGLRTENRSYHLMAASYFKHNRPKSTIMIVQIVIEGGMKWLFE